MTSSFVNVVIVNVVGIGMVIAVDDTMTVSRVVIGTITVWITEGRVTFNSGKVGKTHWEYWSERAVMEDFLLSQELSAASIRAVSLSVTNGKGYSDSLHLS
jgi:hypothetical protein